MSEEREIGRGRRRRRGVFFVSRRFFFGAFGSRLQPPLNPNTTPHPTNSDLRANSQPRKKYSRHFAFKGRGRKRRPAAKNKHERVATRPARH